MGRADRRQHRRVRYADGGGNGCGIPRDRPLDSLCRSARGRAVRRLGRCARRDGLFDDEPRIRAHREIRRLVRWQRPVRRPALAPGYDDSFGLAAVKAGVVLSGRISVEEADGGRELDQDTYLLDLANGDKSFQGINKRASRVPLYFPSSTAYDGWLYTMGFSVYENGGRVIRATPMETLPQPGDLPEPGPGPTPGPGPAAAPEPVVGKGDATSLARTGDPLGAFVPAITLAAGVMLASIGVATAARRKAKKNRL